MEDCDKKFNMPSKGLRQVIVKQCIDCYKGIKKDETMVCPVQCIINDFLTEMM